MEQVLFFWYGQLLTKFLDVLGRRRRARGIDGEQNGQIFVEGTGKLSGGREPRRD